MAVKKSDSPTSTFEMGSAGWAETRDRYPADRMLRDFGFAIHSRPKDGPVLWTKAGKVYEEWQAKNIVTAEIKKLERQKTY